MIYGYLDKEGQEDLWCRAFSQITRFIGLILDIHIWWHDLWRLET